MPDSNLVSALIAALGGGVVAAGAMAAWLDSVWRDRIAHAEAATIQADVDLRLRRIEVYAPLLTLTALLSRWPRHTEATYQDLLDFSKAGAGAGAEPPQGRQGIAPIAERLRRDPRALQHTAHLAADTASRRDSFTA